MPAGDVTALRSVSFEIAPGEYTAITGPSGCGKSTLLHLLGCVDAPSSGSLLFEGRNVAALSDNETSDQVSPSAGNTFPAGAYVLGFSVGPSVTSGTSTTYPNVCATALISSARMRSTIVAMPYHKTSCWRL